VIPDVGALPARQAGHTTFGASCDLSMIGPTTAFHWAGVLDAVEDARLLICNRFDGDQAAIDRCLELFSNMGLRDRIDIVNMADNFATPCEFYGYVDLALDPSPCGDLVEHCRALWMGVPLITLAGDRHAARLGASLLAAAGHPEWIAESPDSLTAVAAGLAGDLDRLAALRARLRGEVAASPLADVHGFTHSLEETYRSMWQRWCAAGGSTGQLTP
jgi:predicted O-linked N-acetylglucosamine transferase (SPINDLY family)